MSDNRSPGGQESTGIDQEAYETSAALCERLEQEPGEYEGKYVGIIRGRIVTSGEDFAAVVQHLQSVEPDRRQHFVAIAGRPQPAEIYNFGLT